VRPLLHLHSFPTRRSSDLFLTGDFGFALNGTWQVNSAAEADFETGVIQIPARDGGVAPAPTGGEFIVAPVQSDTARYDVTRQIVECMTTPEGFVETANTFAYYIPPTAEGQEQLLEEHPDLEPWVEAVRNAKGRTSDGLGTDYPPVSEALWTAIQNALSGASSPQDELEDAQADAEEATSRHPTAAEPPAGAAKGLTPGRKDHDEYLSRHPLRPGAWWRHGRPARGTTAAPTQQAQPEPVDRRGIRRALADLPDPVLRLSAVAQHRSVVARLYDPSIRAGERRVRRAAELHRCPAIVDVPDRPEEHCRIHLRVDRFPVLPGAGAGSLL